jgi:hypothetical protein
MKVEPLTYTVYILFSFSKTQLAYVSITRRTGNVVVCLLRLVHTTNSGGLSILVTIPFVRRDLSWLLAVVRIPSGASV